MKQKFIFVALGVIFLIAFSILQLRKKTTIDDNRFISYIVNPKKQNTQFYWKNDSSQNFGSIQHLQEWLSTKNKKLLFAMNGGMYKQDNSPHGLYIENNTTLAALDTTSGNGNFYLKPNGVFYLLKDNTPMINASSNFSNFENIKYATQSGPMLVINGAIHNAFIKNSSNLNIRNGVGILPDNRIVFAMSKNKINFYEFANYFKMMGCKNALYLDGFVSRTYLPEKNWIQTDGDFAVMIAVTDSLQK
jgi:uncharacterized protein YigE (DUF2233 family)